MLKWVINSKRIPFIGWIRFLRMGEAAKTNVLSTVLNIANTLSRMVLSVKSCQIKKYGH